MDVSKTKSSFYRRLYVAYLIDSGQASSVPALTDATGNTSPAVTLTAPDFTARLFDRVNSLKPQAVWVLR